MGLLTTYRAPDGSWEFYGSTNRFMRFGLERLEDMFERWSGPPRAAHVALTGYVNNLGPSELARSEILHHPAIRMIQHWARIFFSFKGRTGLIPTLADASPRRFFDSTSRTWYRQPTVDDPVVQSDPFRDSRAYATLETRYSSEVANVGRMEEFLSWLPGAGGDPAWENELVRECTAWADAILAVNNYRYYGGHRVHGSGFFLYNMVQVGPASASPEDTTTISDPAERFEQELRISLEGLPDSWLVYVGAYPGLASALLRLAAIVERRGDAVAATEYRTLAAGFATLPWQWRVNRGLYLVPWEVTPHGPLPGELAGDRYQVDSDSLYWANGVFHAYGDVRSGVTLRPPPASDLGTIRHRALVRRRLLAPMLGSGTETAFVGMALGATLDWIRFGWLSRGGHFVRKLFLDGGRATMTIYGDAKYNTFEMLLGAYRFTGDDFYLQLFLRQWETFSVLASHPDLGGLFPSTVDEGRLTTPAVDGAQEVFLDLVVRMYSATVEAGAPRGHILRWAQQFADHLAAAHAAGRWAPGVPNEGIAARAFVRVALATGTLHRVTFNFPAGTAGLIMRDSHGTEHRFKLCWPEPPGGAALVCADRAVVYMDEGTYLLTRVLRDETLIEPPTEVIVSGETSIDLP